MGYIIPENPTPEGYICLKVFIPNDPRYLEAFSGQFHDLATWLVWDRDGTDRASLAARTWKEAVDYTYLNGWLNSCGETMDCCDDILNRLTNIENLIRALDTTVIVDNDKENCEMCNQCGCGCGCNQNQTLPPWGQDPTTDPFPIEPNTNPPGEDSDLCDWGQAMADTNIEIMGKMKRFFAGIAVTAGSVQALIGSLRISIALPEIALMTWPMMIALLQGAISLLLLSNTTDEAADAASQYQKDFKCAIAFSTSPANAAERWRAVNLQIREEYGSLVYFCFWYLSKLINWNNIFTTELPEPWAGAGVCSDCDEFEDPPPPQEQPIDIFEDGSWWFVPAHLGPVGVANNAQFEEADFVWTYSETSNSFPGLWQHVDFSYALASGRTWAAGLPSDVFASPDHGGHVLRRLSSSGVLATYLLTGEGWIGLDDADYQSSDIHAQAELNSELSEAEFTDAVDIAFPGLSVNKLGGIFHTALNSVMAMAGENGSSDGASTFVVYAMIKGTAVNL